MIHAARSLANIIYRSLGPAVELMPVQARQFAFRGIEILKTSNRYT